MGVYACVWVCWGVGGTGNTQIRQWGGNYGLTDPDLGPMDGEISPNIMFCKTNTKWTETAPDGCAGVRMGTIGCMNKGATRNKTKEQKISLYGGYLACMTTAKKNCICRYGRSGLERIKRGEIREVRCVHVA